MGNRDGGDTLLERLNKGPAFLFLGQGYLKLETGADPLLSQLIRKYGLAKDSNYRDALKEDLRAQHEDGPAAWFDERCRRLAVPQWLETVARFHWNGVYSTSYDSMWPRAFRNSWREPQLVVDRKYRPSDPRNQSILHCTCLFGSCNRDEESERPPLNFIDYVQRKLIANELATRLPEFLTPLGTLVVVGYQVSDLYPVQDFGGVLSRLNPGQVHFFEAEEDVGDDDVIKYLTKTKVVEFHEGTLATLLQMGAERGQLRLDQQPETRQDGRTIGISSHRTSVPKDLWNRTQRSANILDDTLLIPPAPISDATLYLEFRHFLSQAEGKPNWIGYARGFAFRRQFLSPLTEQVQKRLEAQGLDDTTVIVHGQTGIGKTVGLAQLALDVCQGGQYPVLYIERRTRRPSIAEIDDFCNWVEDEGGHSTLVVWDGMLPDVQDYSRFAAALAHRGRKVVIVGSAYKVPLDWSERPGFVSVPDSLSSEEADKFLSHLGQYVPDLAARLRSSPILQDPTFLVAIYRLLPTTRGGLRTGVVREVGQAETAMLTTPRAAPKAKELPALARAMHAAGLVAPERCLTERTELIGDEEVDEPKKLTGLVMVPGKFGLAVPLELLVRALGNSGYSQFLALLKSVDIFRWYEDAVGNIEIGPRSSLEAQLVVESRMGGLPAQEISYAGMLLLEIRDDSEDVRGSREVDFAVELVRQMGAKGPSAHYFEPLFGELSGVLKRLREERGVQLPRLMLQEANLLREWVIYQGRQGQVFEVDTLLEQVESVVRRALELLEDAPPNPSLKSQLLVELASAWSRGFQVLLDSKRTSDGISLFRETREIVFESRLAEPTNFYPIDVLYRASEAILKSQVLGQQETAEVKADLLYNFETTDETAFEFGQLEWFQSRRFTLSSLLGLQDMEEEAFAKLVEKGSKAGYYLRAMKISGLPAARTEISANVGRLRDALSYLDGEYENINQDPRCMNLYLDLWWMVHTGTKWFEQERTAIPLGPDEWRKLLEIIDQVEGAGASYRSIYLTFFRALARFHIGDASGAKLVFSEINARASEVYGKRRLVRSYVASEPTGIPRIFHGSIQWIGPDGRKGGVRVEELGETIPFQVYEFSRRGAVHKGESLGEFHIAFNFIGPIADKPRHSRRTQ